jgi:hypothetical protein
LLAYSEQRNFKLEMYFAECHFSKKNKLFFFEKGFDNDFFATYFENICKFNFV